MNRTDLQELHYITPIANLPSIRQHGLLSHNRVKKLPSQSIAMPEIQERRERVQIPGGQPLHNYVNFYINARNPISCIVFLLLMAMPQATIRHSGVPSMACQELRKSMSSLNTGQMKKTRLKHFVRKEKSVPRCLYRV